MSQFAYTVNAIGQRETLTSNSGTTNWGYNAKGEVVSASHNNNAQLSSAYQYDGIGNRQKAVSGSTDLNASGAVNYTANAKNQYSSVGSNNLTYDADGNLTDDGTKQYVWDSEQCD